jgi:hypothetical protein
VFVFVSLISFVGLAGGIERQGRQREASGFFKMRRQRENPAVPVKGEGKLWYYNSPGS